MVHNRYIRRTPLIQVYVYNDTKKKTLIQFRSKVVLRQGALMWNLIMVANDLEAIQRRWLLLSRGMGYPFDTGWLKDIAYGVNIAIATVEAFAKDPQIEIHAICNALRQLDQHWESLIKNPRGRRDKRNPECVRDGIGIIRRRFSHHLGHTLNLEKLTGDVIHDEEQRPE